MSTGSRGFVGTWREQLRLDTIPIPACHSKVSTPMDEIHERRHTIGGEHAVSGGRCRQLRLDAIANIGAT